MLFAYRVANAAKVRQNEMESIFTCNQQYICWTIKCFRQQPTIICYWCANIQKWLPVLLLVLVLLLLLLLTLSYDFAKYFTIWWLRIVAKMGTAQVKWGSFGDLKYVSNRCKRFGFSKHTMLTLNNHITVVIVRIRTHIRVHNACSAHIQRERERPKND